MGVHIKHLLSTIRFYSTGSYADKTPYDAIATVQFIDDNEAFICALHGTINRSGMRELIEILINMGVSIIRYDRRGKNKSIHLTKKAP